MFEQIFSFSASSKGLEVEYPGLKTIENVTVNGRVEAAGALYKTDNSFDLSVFPPFVHVPTA